MLKNTPEMIPENSLAYAVSSRNYFLSAKLHLFMDKRLVLVTEQDVNILVQSYSLPQLSSTVDSVAFHL